MGSTADSTPGGAGGAGTHLAGATSGLPPLQGGTLNKAYDNGGGGGGVGRIRINSPDTTLSGIFSPALSTTGSTTGALTTRPLLK